MLLACGAGGEPDPAPVVRAPRPLDGAVLAPGLPERPYLVSREGRPHWETASGSHEVLRGIVGRWLEVATPDGTLRVDWDLLEAWNPRPLRDLPRLLGHARAAGLELSKLTLYPDPLAGSYLQARGVYVLREGVLRHVARADPERPEPAELLARLQLAVRGAREALADVDASPATRVALSAILAQVAVEDEAGSIESLPPAFARRLVRAGWPADLGLPPSVLGELRGAVQAATVLRPEARFAGASSALTWWTDALGNGVWTLSTPERAGFARPEPGPAYFYDTRPATLVVRLPPGADPLREASRWEAAELYLGPARIAAHDAGGFAVDRAGWRRAYPLSPELADPGMLPDALPPHLLVVAPDGDVLALVTAHGVLRPARDGSPQEVERFVADAAAVLPDAAHLDLIGQHLVVYAYDSPDTRRPGLVGTAQIAGDIHQTAPETLATHVGGRYRGDCDDLSELYLEIARRQGRTAHLIGLPAHAALAWAEPDDAGWRTYVLHTGQPRLFAGSSLRESLERAYKSFGSGEVLDFTKLEILLRFSGENTRSSWYLSDRVFADAQYARTMIDVQRDWHFQTYQRAIVKMQRMLGDGDVDAGNLSELAGLYHYTGQYARAARTLERGAELAGSAQTRLSMQVDRLSALLRSGRRDAARELVEALRRAEIPALEAEMQRSLVEPYLSLADALLDRDGDPALGLDVLADDVTPRIDPLIRELGRVLRESGGSLGWSGDESDAVRYQMRWYVATAVRALNVTRSGELRAHPARVLLAASTARWIDQVAFGDLDPSESVLTRYAVVGRWHRGVDPDWDERVEAAGPITDGAPDHRDRTPGDALRERDLRWTAASPAYWSGQLAELFSEHDGSVDLSPVPGLVERVLATRARAQALGLDHPGFDENERDALLMRALVQRDAELLRRLLRGIRSAGDRRERVEIASWLAAAARALPLDWYREVMGIFRAELNYKPLYFWIAWNAALSGAPQHALLVADLAAREFADDPAFAQERDFMRDRFGAAPARSVDRTRRRGQASGP